MTQEMPTTEEVVSTSTTRIASDVAAMVHAVAWHKNLSAAELLTPLVRQQVTEMFNALPDEVRRVYLARQTA
jgi:hypothetical protein